VRDEAELESSLRGLLGDRERCEELSRKARAVVDENRGAAGRTVSALREILR
jgi:hypothetical protein